MNKQENTLQAEIVTDQYQSELNNGIIEAFKNQELLNKINHETISKHGESIRWLLISNFALIIALVVLLFK